MFYSHQLLARKAPLGQIWIAATLNNKIKRSNLEKLNIPRICEEILNPSIPMALRLSGILMGGVVNVFKRKVDFLYDDVNRFLENLNRVFKAKVAGDSGGKTQAKGKAHARSNRTITIEDKEDVEVDLDQYTIRSIPLFDVARFQNMTLEDLDDQYINIHVGGTDPSVHHQQHQADPADITLPDKYDLGTIRTGNFEHSERFDNGDETFTQTEFMSQILPDTPQQAPKSPPPPHAPDKDNAMKEKKIEEKKPPPKADEPEVLKSIKEEPGLCRPFKRKARRNFHRVISDEQTMIPNETYHSWLNDVSDISSLRRRRKTKPATNILRTTKIENLMNLPPLCLMPSSSNFLREIHYPELLMELWWKPNMGNPQTPLANNNKASHSFPENVQHLNFSELPEQADIDFEKMLAANESFNLARGGIHGGFTSSGSHGEASQAIHSSETVHNQLTSGRSNKRQNSSSIANLDTVAEGYIMPDIGANLTEPMVETGPSLTPYYKAAEPSVDKVTESIRTQLKLHFDTPGNSQAESLNHLADGLTRKKASILFYHTCVMATLEYVKVEQLVPYGDISISRGPKM